MNTMNQVRTRQKRMEMQGALRAAEATMRALPSMEMPSEAVHKLLAELYLKGKRNGEALGRAVMRGRNRFL